MAETLERPRPALDLPELPGAAAVLLLAEARRDPGRCLVHVAQSGRDADELLAILQGLDPGLTVALYPAWDSLPYDRTPTSRAVMGTRLAVLRRLVDGEDRPALLLSTAPALLRRVPARAAWAASWRTIRIGDALDLAELAAELERIGYLVDDRVDEPGEVALHGRVIDLFPAGSAVPYRIEHTDGVVIEIRTYDAVSQRSSDEVAAVTLGPAVELVDAAAGAVSFFEAVPNLRLSAGRSALIQLRDFLDQVREAHDNRLADGIDTLPPERLFLDEAGWQAAVDRYGVRRAEPGPVLAVPRFVAEADPGRAFQAFLAERADSMRIVVTAAERRTLRTMLRRAERALDRDARLVDGWDEVAVAPAGSLLALRLPIERGFVLGAAGIVVVAARDLLGSRASAAAASARAVLPIGELDFRFGDVVVHEEHGLAILEGLDRVTLGEDGPEEVARLRFQGERILLVPLHELARIWRYGGDGAAVSLDRLDGDGWQERRREIEQAIEAAARHMVELVEERGRAEAPKLVPPARDYERFVARFPYALSPDQAGAVDAVLADLASGHPMDRLVCGDVGFGKTEVALRAAAAVALAGRQVAIVAPTTVLARQHLRSFQRRFAPFGIEVGLLSRLVSPADARKVKADLASGALRVVIGTHALAAKGVGFAELGLVVIDEEQRFGSEQKAKLRALGGEGVHVLTLTATPIPRTLQASLIGLQELSVIATAPVLRQPTRTILAEFDRTAVREALRREKRRDGQSFVVCPRIEDLAPMAARLQEIVPELMVRQAHGRMPADQIDEVMTGFADGADDVLLATNIIESGLDVPRANTMLVWHPDRFGLAQLHQLRGRVGRGARRGVVHLLTEPGHRLAPATEKRLRTLEALDRLGAGFEISARDLDLRGAGDLTSAEQTGHVRMIGLGLYQHLLERALAAARGQPIEAEWLPDLRLGPAGGIPGDYVPDDELRLNLHAQLARIDEPAELEAFAAEIEDRFGDLPDAVVDLLQSARLRVLSRELRIARIEGGPQALALTPRPDGDVALAARLPDWEIKGARLVLAVPTADARERRELARSRLERATRHPPGRAAPARPGRRCQPP